MKRSLLLILVCMFLRSTFAQPVEDEKLQGFFKNYLEQFIISTKNLTRTAFNIIRELKLKDIRIIYTLL